MQRLGVMMAMALMALGLVACANSGTTPTTFSPQSQTALLVLAGPKWEFAANTGMRRVDLSSGRFESEYQGFGTGALTGGQIRSDGPVHFSVREVLPGDYALVSVLMVPGSTTYWSCMPEGGPVFTLRPGQVTIVNTLPYWMGSPVVTKPAPVSDTALLDAFASARMAHPGLTGEARVVPVVATILWRSGMGATRNCSESPTFERIG